MSENQEVVQASEPTKYGIEETLELINAVKTVSVHGKKILKDGINASDIPLFVAMAKDFQIYIDGVKGSNLVLKELKDLDAVETAQVLAAAYDLVKSVVEA